MPFDEVWLYTDGASRGNPGPAAAGFRIIRPSNELLLENQATLGVRTNNQAEYEAVIRGLEACRRYTRRRVRVGSDSDLLVHQMRGEWRIRNPGLLVSRDRALAVAASFEDVHYRHYPRTHPEIAKVDRALNQLLDGLLQKG